MPTAHLAEYLRQLPTVLAFDTGQQAPQITPGVQTLFAASEASANPFGHRFGLTLPPSNFA